MFPLWLAGLLLGLWGTAGVDVVLGQPVPQPPEVLALEGRLVGATGQPLGSTNAANYVAVFRVWDNLTGGALLWTEQQTMTVRDGRFAVLIGVGSRYGNEARPSLVSIFGTSKASDRFLEVSVRGPGTQDGWLTVAPRTRLVAGAYSLLSTRAKSARNILSPSGQTMVSAIGTNVGINKANPVAPLDVEGSTASLGLAVSGNVTVQGAAEADGFNGLGMAPVGSIVMWSGNQPPAGWVLCDGSIVAGVRTPDLRGRFVMSPATTNESWTAAGRETYAHQPNELPVHQHRAQLRHPSDPNLDDTHEYRVAMGGRDVVLTTGLGPANSKFGTVTTSGANDHVHSVTLPSFSSAVSGAGAPRNMMPPFYVLAFIMRVQ